MILSTSKVNKLLEIFLTSKSLYPYNNSTEKQEIENAKTFINNYHMYGSPHNYLNASNQTYNARKKTNLTSIDNQSNYSENSLKKSKTLMSERLTNRDDMEIKQSLTNLKIGQENYKKERNFNQKMSSLHRPISMYGYNNASYNGFPSQNINNSYKQSLYMSNNLNYNRYSNNGMNMNLSSHINIIRSLRDIPPNPDDVVIKNLPPNFSQVAYPVSNSNINMIPSTLPNDINEGNAPMPENNSIPPMVEEINTDIIQEHVEEPVENLPKEEENKIEEEPQEEPTPVKTGKYQVTALNGPIKLPDGYSTDDINEFNAIQMINDDISTWKLQIDKPDYKIYSKPFKVTNEDGEEGESRMFYLDATIDFPASEVNKQINSFELRKNWEESLKKGKLIKEEDLGNGVKIIDYYGYIKMPIIFSDRDMVVRKTIWENYLGEQDCCLNEIHSIEHPDFPAKEKPVRAILENKSKYIKPIGPNKTKFYYVNKFNMKVNVGGSMMESKGADGTEKWFKSFLKQLGK